MSPAEIKRELHEINGIDRNKLALPPRILVDRSTDHGSTMVAFHTETDATLKVYPSEYCYPRDYIETGIINCHRLTHPRRSGESEGYR